MADHGFGVLEDGSGVADTKLAGRTFPLRVALAKYDFSVDGGAVAQITPKLSPVIPAGSIIFGASMHVTTACTSGGSATVSADLAAGADIVAATAVASLTDDAVIAGKIAPDASPITLLADQAIKVTVGTAALTAGQIEVAVIYAPSTEGAS